MIARTLLPRINRFGVYASRRAFSSVAPKIVPTSIPSGDGHNYFGTIDVEPLNPPPSENDLISLMFSAGDGPGSLSTILALFSKYSINLTRIESRPSRRNNAFDFVVDFGANNEDAKVQALLRELNGLGVATSFVEPTLVPWFPTHISDIDSFSIKTLDAGSELDSDHPGFSDALYRERRRIIVEGAQNYKHGNPLPTVEYMPHEIETWGVIYNKLRTYTDKYAISNYKENLVAMEKHCGYAPNNIPQLQDISNFLKDRTGFTLRPVGGLLSARDFLNGLAFRVFFSTQYLRHHSVPLYTPEPDIVHELLGHAPMFADPDFADFSHEIGLASLGASDEEIKKLATCYWFSVEFGLCLQDGEKKAYGAGLLSSFGELEYSCSPTRPAGGVDQFPEYRPWVPAKAALQDYPITTYQPVYYVAESLADAKTKMRQYCEDTMKRPFRVRWDPQTQSVSTDRAVIRGAYNVTMQK